MATAIPDELLGFEQKLVASQIGPYHIYAGPGGTWIREWYSSELPEFREYLFYLRSVIMDKDGYYYLTIRKMAHEEEPGNPENP
jgi:hypothetical protein